MPKTTINQEKNPVFQNVDAYAGDPILSLMEKFKQDPRAHKVNLSIGLYYDAQGIIPQMRAVAAAQAQLNSVEHGASVYLPMEGLQPYRSAIQHLLFGAQHPMLQQGRIATIQTVGGSGALKVGADFLKATSRIRRCGSAIRPGKTTSPSSAAPVSR